MSTVAAPSRNENYTALQGYRKWAWAVTLYREDTAKTYTATEEAFDMPVIRAALESDRYSIFRIPDLTVDFARTTDFLTFIKGLTTPRYLEIVVECYPLFIEELKYKVWMGRLQNLPEGTDVYIGDSFRMKFVGNPAHWGDADDVKDPNTSTWYKDKHVTDTVIPALMKEAAEKAPSPYVLQAPELKGDSYFWSAYERPYKKLASTAVSYDGTCKCSALCWDSTNDLLYVGVHDVAGSETDGWILSYDPATRKWAKVTQIKYTGGKKELRRPTEWEIQHLEYSSGVVYGVARTNHTNLLHKQAHFHCKFNFTVAATPTKVALTDANLFTLHDKGQKIHAKPQSWYNYLEPAAPTPVTTDSVDYYMYAQGHTVGWGTAVHDTKEAGALRYAADITAYMPSGHIVYKGMVWWSVTKDTSKANHPKVGYHVQVYDDHYNRFQYLGKILEINDDPSRSYFFIRVQRPADNDYQERTAVGTDIYIYFNGDYNVPENNLFIAEPGQVEIEYDFPSGLGSVDPATILIEGLKDPWGVEQYFWPRKYGSVDEDDKFIIPYTGYTSFVTLRSPAVYYQDDPVTYYKYYAGNCAPFTVKLKGYNPAYLIADNFWVRSELQDHTGKAERNCNQQPGKCQLVYNGTVCTVSDGKKLETYGNIFLWKDGSTVYAAWNDHGRDTNGRWFSQCKVARWTGSIFQKMWVDRWGNDWYEKAERYITSFAVHKNKVYLGIKYYEPNWVDTQLRIYWAGPPQSNVKPSNYEGGLVAICAVKGDKTDLIEEGDLMTVGTSTQEGYKIYHVADVATGERDIAGVDSDWGTSYLATGESAYTGQITWFSLMEVDRFAPGQYAQKIRGELMLDRSDGGYIYLMKGRDERHQICRLDGTTLTVLYTAQPDAGEPAEGGEVDWNEAEFQGESHKIEYDDEYLRSPRVELDNPNVVANTIVVKLKDSGRTLDLTDYTTDNETNWYQNWPIPLEYQVFAHRQQGSDYQTCYLYFPPSLDGEAIDVQYEYYLNGAAIKWPVVYGGDLYFCETGPRHRWLKLNGSSFDSTYSPRLGDYDLTVAIAGEDRIWAVGVPSYLLLQYYTKWTGHTSRVYGEDTPIWAIVAGLARAGDQYCFMRNDKTYIVNRTTASQPVTLTKVLNVEKADLDPYKRVILSYDNGKVDYGSGKPELSLSCPYVFDKGHAEIIVKNAYDHYNSINTLYKVRVAGIMDQYDLLQEVLFDYQGTPVAGIAIWRELGKGVTDFTVHEKIIPSGSRV